MRVWLGTVSLLATLVPLGAWATPAEDLKAFVGGRNAKLVAIDRADDNIYVLDTAKGSLERVSLDVGCKSPLLSPDGTRIVYHQSGKVFTRPLDGSDATEITAGSDGHFWSDKDGDEWIYYTTNTKEKKLRWPDAKGIETRRLRLRDKHDEFVVAWKGGGGPSKDGTHVGSGYASVVLFDLPNDAHHLLYYEKENEAYGQGCNPSMSPDDSYYLMHLDIPHETFSIRDKEDRLAWQITNPEGTDEWEFPEWSNDGDFATATARVTGGADRVYVVKISTSEVLGLDLGTAASSWTYPHLWIEDAKPEVPKALHAAATTSDPEPKTEGGCALSGVPRGGAAAGLLLLAGLMSLRRRRRVRPRRGLSA